MRYLTAILAAMMLALSIAGCSTTTNEVTRVGNPDTNPPQTEQAVVTYRYLSENPYWKAIMDKVACGDTIYALYFDMESSVANVTSSSATEVYSLPLTIKDDGTISAESDLFIVSGGVTANNDGTTTSSLKLTIKSCAEGVELIETTASDEDIQQLFSQPEQLKEKQASCTDSDANLGNHDIYTKGTVDLSYGVVLGNSNLTDYCATPTALVEYSCSTDAGKPASTKRTIICDCKDGACVSPVTRESASSGAQEPTDKDTPSEPSPTTKDSSKTDNDEMLGSDAINK